MMTVWPSLFFLAGVAFGYWLAGGFSDDNDSESLRLALNKIVDLDGDWNSDLDDAINIARLATLKAGVKS